MDARFPVTTARLIIAFAFAIAGAAVQTACTYPGSPALDALRTRAEAGNVESQYRLGLRHSSGRDVEQDYETANAWFARAALAGYAPAQFMMGIAHYAGRGAPIDHPRAVAWFEKAAEQGYARAQYQLGDAYLNGRGVMPAPEWAARWFEKAAAQGHADSQFSLAVAFASGLGVPIDKAEARTWLLLAQANGHEDAVRLLASVTANLAPDDIARSDRQAAVWAPSAEAEFADRATVRFVENALSLLGYEPGPVDGFLDDQGRSAIGEFRRAANESIHGAVDRNLVALLRRDLRARNAGKPGG